MKKLLLLLSLIISISVKAQYGYYPSGEKDTVKAIFQICDTTNWSCSYYTFYRVNLCVSGYAIREKQVYVGDKMPPSNYDDKWVVIDFLNDTKNKFRQGIVIWDYKLIK